MQEVGPLVFSVERYEAEALVNEGLQRLTVPAQLGGGDAQAVAAYLEAGRVAAATDGECTRLAAEGAPNAEQRACLLRLTAMRDQLAEGAPRMERLIETQVADVLADEGLGWLGLNLPPPAFDFTETPTYLVISPRDSIGTKLGVYLQPGLSVAQREQVEQAIEARYPDVSALVDDTGGLSTWPSMLVDSGGLRWTIEVVAHEWVHAYLILYPLGRAYDRDSDTRAINETVADLVCTEVAQLVMERYYPDFLPPEGEAASALGPKQKRSREEMLDLSRRFDFRAQMRLTREEVDRLLAEGQVEEAERYMEARRQDFVAHGHAIRRLNQAFFAYHGSYRSSAAAPVDDPVLPRLEALREQVGSLSAFMREVRSMQSLDDLVRAVPEP